MVEYFKERLFASPVRDCITKILLFGSVAKGESKAESDIDLLIIGGKDLKKIEEAVIDAELETGARFGKSVESLVRCTDWIRFSQSELSRQISKEAKEIYRMEDEDAKRLEAESYFDLAEEYIEHAEYDLRGAIFRGAVEAAHNACELLLKGLLVKKIGILPRSHSGVVMKFSEVYIKEGAVSQDVGRELRRLLKRRNDARYEPHIEITKEEAEDSVRFAKRLIKIARAL